MHLVPELLKRVYGKAGRVVKGSGRPLFIHSRKYDTRCIHSGMKLPVNS